MGSQLNKLYFPGPPKVNEKKSIFHELSCPKVILAADRTGPRCQTSCFFRGPTSQGRSLHPPVWWIPTRTVTAPGEDTTKSLAVSRPFIPRAKPSLSPSWLSSPCAPLLQEVYQVPPKAKSHGDGTVFPTTHYPTFYCKISRGTVRAERWIFLWHFKAHPQPIRTATVTVAGRHTFKSHQSPKSPQRNSFQTHRNLHSRQPDGRVVVCVHWWPIKLHLCGQRWGLPEKLTVESQDHRLQKGKALCGSRGSWVQDVLQPPDAALDHTGA